MKTINKTILAVLLALFSRINQAEEDRRPNQVGVYWAAPFDAIAAGMERCHQFSTPSLEDQRDRLIKKYGSDLKGVKIITREDGSHVFVANRHDQATGEDVKYAYFDSLAACNSYQDQVFNIYLQEQQIAKQEDTNGKANNEVKATAIQEVRDEMNKEEVQVQNASGQENHKESNGTIPFAIIVIGSLLIAVIRRFDSYVESNLMPDEKVIYKASVNKINLLPAVLPAILLFVLLY